MSEQPEVVDAQATEVARTTDEPGTGTDLEPRHSEVIEHRTETAKQAAWRYLSLVANVVAKTEFVPEAYRGKPAACMAALLYGADLGLGEMQSLQAVHVIKGKPTLSAEAMRALIIAAGHSIDVLAYTNEVVTMCGRRGDTGKEVTVSFSMEDARTAGLASSGSNYGKYPRAMLSARCTSELGRLQFPDVLMGVSYTPEEMDDERDPEPEPEGPIPMDPSPEPPLRIVTRDHRDAGKVIASGTGVNEEAVLTPRVDLGGHSVPAAQVVEDMPIDPLRPITEEERAEHRPFKGWPYSYVTNADGFNIRTCNACTHPCDQHSEIRRGCTICTCRNTFPPQPDDDDPAPTAAPVVAEAPSSDSSPPPARESEAGPLPTSTFRAVHAALRDCGFGDDERHALIGWVTNGRTDSSKGLTPDDAEVLLNLLGKVKSGTIQVDFTLDGSGAEVTATNDRGVAFLRGLATRV